MVRNDGMNVVKKQEQRFFMDVLIAPGERRQVLSKTISLIDMTEALSIYSFTLIIQWALPEVNRNHRR